MSLPFKKWMDVKLTRPPWNITSDDLMGVSKPNPFEISEEQMGTGYEIEFKAMQQRAQYEARAAEAARAAARAERVNVMARQIFANLFCQPAMMIHTAEERFNIAQREAEAYFNLEK